MKMKLSIIAVVVTLVCLLVTGCETSAETDNPALDDTTITVDTDNDGDTDVTININASSARWGTARFGQNRWAP